MRTISRLSTALTKAFLALALAASLTATVTSRADASEMQPRDAAAAAKTVAPAEAIHVSFKLDPRLTGGLYMGPRWVSPDTYDTIQPGNSFVLEARAEAANAYGETTVTASQWTASDHDMVEITPGVGHTVKITVRSAGRSTLKVDAGGMSQSLTVSAQAVQCNSALRVMISRTGATLGGDPPICQLPGDALRLYAPIITRQ